MKNWYQNNGSQNNGSGMARLVVLTLLASSVATALAAAPVVAMVESVVPPVPGIAEMAYLVAGADLDLPPGTVLVLDYLGSCVRETITGGHVRVGTTESDAAGGSVARERTNCDGKALLHLAASESDVGGAPVWRRVPGATAAALPDADLTLASTVPVIVLPAGAAGRLRIERLDAEAPLVDTEPDHPAGTARASLDLARHGVALDPGGLYRVSAGGVARVVRVAPHAASAATPLVGRLLPL